MSKSPIVSVIIATYNRSNVLRFALETALWQTVADIEVLVIGDGCTDDSADVVASFQDPRLRWHNLPSNTGGQSIPNNTGLAMARAPYVAYLGHDDLWMKHHLEVLVAAIEREQAALAYSLGVALGPAGSEIRVLSGVSPSGAYEPGVFVAPSTVLHRADMIAESGPWRHYRSLNAPADVTFISDAWAAGKRFAAVRELTVFKFSAAWRKNVHRDLPCEEQAEYVRRMRSEPDFLERETLAIALAYAEGRARDPVFHAPPPAGAPPGWQTEQWLRYKGIPIGDEPRARAPIYSDAAALRMWNHKEDIVPPDGVEALRHTGTLPVHGLFLGRGWHDLEQEPRGPFRWVNTDAEIVITRPGDVAARLALEAESGPGMGVQPFELQLCDEEGIRVGAAVVSRRHDIYFDVPPLRGEGAVFRLVAPSGGLTIPSDPRVLNFRVFRMRWAKPRRRWI